MNVISFDKEDFGTPEIWGCTYTTHLPTGNTFMNDTEVIGIDLAQEGADATVTALIISSEKEGIKGVSARAIVAAARRCGKTATQHAYFDYLQEVIAKGEVVVINDLEPIELKNYAADLEHCQPSAADWFDDRRHSKCKKRRREARGWR